MDSDAVDKRIIYAKDIFQARKALASNHPTPRKTAP
jgi:hypothetical protein